MSPEQSTKYHVPFPSKAWPRSLKDCHQKKSKQLNKFAKKDTPTLPDSSLHPNIKTIEQIAKRYTDTCRTSEC